LAAHTQAGIDLQHVNVRLRLASPEKVDLAAVVPVFHQWIQDQVFAGPLLDVADYRHVPNGPGVILIGHEGDFSVDNTDGLLSVRYNRKAPLEGNNQDRLHQATRSALMACQKLASDRALNRCLRFDGRNMEFFINDRLLAPNVEETRTACLPEFELFFGRLLDGKQYSMSFNKDPRRLLTVFLKTDEPIITEFLLDNLSS
jgi:hypothetical protein